MQRRRLTEIKHKKRAVRLLYENLVAGVGFDFYLWQKSSVPRGSKQNKLAYFVYSLTRPVEPTILVAGVGFEPTAFGGGYEPNKKRATRLLYPAKIWLRGLDLNQRPFGYEPNELPGCSTPRRRDIIYYLRFLVKSFLAARRITSLSVLAR